MKNPFQSFFASKKSSLGGPNLKLPFLTELRKGMWVVYNDEPGVVTAFNANGTVDVMLVTPDKGENRLAIRCTVGELRQARYLEIPYERRQGKIKAAFHQMGYAE